MKREQVKAMFPNASESTIKANSDCVLSGAELERFIRDGALAEKKRKDSNPKRRLVSITSYRVRGVDPDNLCGKYFVDSLRYSGILFNDTAEDITYQISQKKVAHKTQEKTLIEVT